MGEEAARGHPLARCTIGVLYETPTDPDAQLPLCSLDSCAQLRQSGFVTAEAATAPDSVREAAVSSLRRLLLARTGLCVLLGSAAVAVVYTWQTRLALVAAASSVTTGGLYGVAAYRAFRARLVVQRAPGRPVRYQGWCRPPDGCNYALFAADTSVDRPFAVIRLPIVREMSSGSGWLFHRNSESAAALVGGDGELLGAGRVIDDGIARWLRRDDGPSRFVMKPPDFKPPAG